MRGSIGLLILLLRVDSTLSLAPSTTLHRHGQIQNADTPSQVASSSSFSTARSSCTRLYSSYGKGSEIYPKCNEEPIELAASFPAGVIPQPAQDLLASSSSTTSSPGMASKSSSSTQDTTEIDKLSESSTITNPRGRKRRAIRMTLSHILKSAAAASSRRARSADLMETEYGVPAPAIDKGPAILAAALLLTKCVRVDQMLSVIGMSMYIVGLASWCAAPKRTSTDIHHPIVNMPSLPAKGHVPNLISNPLGASLTNSRLYRVWLRLGALLGILLPTVVLSQLIIGSTNETIMNFLDWMIVGDVGQVKQLVGGPMFLLCFQALTEAVARSALLPLPIRILIPVSYNTLRLSSLKAWAFGGTMIPKSLQALGVANLLYWYANLFLFLIPVGVVRYLRAHFFCVEAVEVTVRKGGEGSVGILP